MDNKYSSDNNYEKIEKRIKKNEAEAYRLVKEYEKNKVKLILDYIVFIIWLFWGGIHVAKRKFDWFDYTSMWIILMLSLSRNVLNSKIDISNTKIKILSFLDTEE